MAYLGSQRTPIKVAMFSVRCAGQQFDADVARHDPGQIAQALRDAKATYGHAECLCVAPPRRLVIRERLGRHHLAVWPEDGHHHDPACVFFREPESRSGDDAQRIPALIESDEGFDIRPDFALVRQKRMPSVPSDDGDGAAADAGKSRRSRARMPMLGLLRFLWQASDLNRWARGWQRDYWRVRRQLQAAAESGVIAGRELAGVLYIPPPYRADHRAQIERDWSSFLQPLAASSGQDVVRSGLVVGEAKDMAPSRHGFGLRLRHHRETLYLAEQLHQQVSRKFLRALTRIGRDEGYARVIVLAQVELTPSGYVRIVDLALMPTSRDYIPVDSSYEARIANELVDGNRTFVKPLRYDEEEALLPDFILRDTVPETCLGL
jgi:hypothetical protein